MQQTWPSANGSDLALTSAVGTMRATNSIVITVLVASSAHAFSTPRLTRPVVTTKHSAITTKRCSTSKMALEVVDPSYNLALGSIALGSIFGLPGSPLKNKITAFVPGALLAVFGLFIAFQTTTLRFTFDDDSFALVKADLSSTGENVVVGGANDWQYKTFVNCARNTHLFIHTANHSLCSLTLAGDFLPSESFPILVYFRETQTPAGVREEVPLEVDTLDGQVHFFPAISDAQQLKAGFIKAGCAKI